MDERADRRGDEQAVRLAVQNALHDSLQLAAGDPIVVPAGAIRKTSSGKVARRRLEQLFEAGFFDRQRTGKR
jgi:acyl-CoA synthetase (AMP-forming)/AMP-acid ligase II